MTTAATIWAKLGLDATQYNSELQSAVSKTQGLKDIGGKMMGIGAGMTAGLTVPILAAGTAMVGAASDLEESTNAVNVVFGDSAKIIESYGETVASTAGLAQSEFNQLAAVTGAFLKNVGLDTDQAADKTIELTQRAADMASIFNTDVSSALGAIQSGLKGEFNPLEQFGVKLNAAAIEAYALENGLAATKEELTDSIKAQAGMALIMEQTEQLAGDFVNTSDGLANSTRIMKAEFTDAAAALGTQLLPIGLKLVQFLSGLIDKFNSLTPAQQKTILIVAGIAAAIGPLITIVGGLISAIGAVVPVITAVAGVISFPLIAIIAAVIGFVALLIAAWKNNWGGIRETVDYALSQIKTLWEAFSALFQGDWRTFGEKLREVWDRAWEFVKERLDTFISFLKNIDWKNMGSNIVKGLINGIQALRQWAINTMIGFAQGISDAFKGFFGIESPSTLMENLIGKNIALGIVEGYEKNMVLDPALAMPDIKSSIPIQLDPAFVIPNVGGANLATINPKANEKPPTVFNFNITGVVDSKMVDYLAQEVTKVQSK